MTLIWKEAAKKIVEQHGKHIFWIFGFEHDWEVDVRNKLL